MVDTGQIEYDPDYRGWYRVGHDGRSAADTITWTSALTGEQIEAMLGKYSQPAKYWVRDTDFDIRDNRFCLEQDDSEAEVESDEALPEFLDTFEVKEGD